MQSAEPFAAPVVDSLSVRVVVDSVFDQFMPKATHPMVAIEHVGRIRNRLHSTLAGEWGLSLHLQSRAGGASAEYLLDSATRRKYCCAISSCSTSTRPGSTA